MMNLAKEPPSRILPEFTDQQPYKWGDGVVGVEGVVGPYQVCVRWDWRGAESFEGKQHAMLQISRTDGGSVFDWRDLQQIKNRVVGEHWEAIELFPDERRLKDPSNARYLWCRELRFEFGIQGERKVLNSNEAIAPQRPLPESFREFEEEMRTRTVPAIIRAAREGGTLAQNARQRTCTCGYDHASDDEHRPDCGRNKGDLNG